MKQLVAVHKTEIEASVDLDLAAVETITYLHDFDREVQYALSSLGIPF